MSTSVNQCKELMSRNEWIKASNAFFHVFFTYPTKTKLFRQYKKLYESLKSEEKAMLSDPEFADGMDLDEDSEAYLRDLADEAAQFNTQQSEGL